MGPERALLQAHWQAHTGGSGRRVVMGYLPPDDDLRRDLRIGRYHLDWVKVQLSDWWEEGFAAMAQPSHRFAYTDVLSGNLSLPTQLFHEVGGFDPDYYPCHNNSSLAYACSFRRRSWRSAREHAAGTVVRNRVSAAAAA